MMDTMAAAHAVNGRLLGSPATFMRVTTDSRLIARDDLCTQHLIEVGDRHWQESSLRTGGS